MVFPPPRSSSTLYDAIRPIRLTLALFGFDVAPELPRFIPLTAQTLMFLTIPPSIYVLINIVADRIRPERRQSMNEFQQSVGSASIVLNAIFYWSVWSARKTLPKLIKNLRQFPIRQKDAKRISALFLIITIGIQVVYFIRDFSEYEYFYSFTSRPLEVLVGFLGKIFIIFVCNFYAPMLVLASVLALYAAASVEETVDGIRRSHSPFRKARMMSGLIRHYERMRKTLVEADPIFSWHFFALKIVSLIYFSICISSTKYFWQIDATEVASVVASAIVTTYFPILAYYLHLTFRANNVGLVICKCAARCELNDVGRNNAKCLFKVKVDALTQLVHLRMDHGPFTLAGEPIAKDLFYSMVLDWMDSMNLLSDKSIGYY